MEFDHSDSHSPSSSPPPLSQLPSDHLISILLHLPTPSIISFSLTCKRHHSLALSNSLWESVCRHLDDTWMACVSGDISTVSKWHKSSSGFPSGRFGHTCVMIHGSAMLYKRRHPIPWCPRGRLLSVVMCHLLVEHMLGAASTTRRCSFTAALA
ncbi:F-box/kelch-repeat protein-like protein [Drosera capensis]